MMNDATHVGPDELRYLDAHCVHGPAGTLAGFEVRTADDQLLGQLDGVLLAPAQRRVCFFVVQTTGLIRRRRYLVSLDSAPHVETDRSILRVEAQSDEVVPSRFDARGVRPFSDEDAVTAIFAPRAA